MPLLLGAVGSLISIYVVIYTSNLPYWLLNSLILLYGIFSATEIIVFAMAKEVSGVKITGTVFAVTNMIVTLLGAIFQPLVGWILDIFGHGQLVDGHYHYLVEDYQRALSILPLSLVVVIFLCFLVKERKTS